MIFWLVLKLEINYRFVIIRRVLIFFLNSFLKIVF